MSILILFLILWGVSWAKLISYYDDEAPVGPIVSRQQERRICAELCLSGLGGAPCGDTCLDVTPQIFMNIQSDNGTHKYVGRMRRDVCPVLCDNFLGEPLCQCDRTPSSSSSSAYIQADFGKVCTIFCNKYKYKLYGCYNCNVYKKTKSTITTAKTTTTTKLPFNYRKVKLLGNVRGRFDPNLWCQKMCKEGEGGAACYCDLLPMSAI